MQHAIESNPNRPRSRWARAAVLAPLLVSLAGLTLWTFVGGEQKSRESRETAAEASLLGTPASDAGENASRSRSDETANAAPSLPSPEGASTDKPSSPLHTLPADAKPEDARHSTIILGQWHDEYRGQRHLTIRSDGTATMVVEPDSLGKLLFADKLTFQIEWHIRDGHIVMKTVGGEPEGKTKLVTKIYGDRADYQIRELTDDRLLLLDPDGKTEYDWRRPE